MRHPSEQEKREAVVAIGRELQRRGWTLYGWKEHCSEPQTDYYDPVAWDGIAERDGFVAAVYVTPYTRTRSGGQMLVRYVPGATCPRCAGRRADPSGWTYQRAKVNPVAYHRDRSEGTGAAALFPDVVSPLHFLGYGPGEEGCGDLKGLERCRDCAGRGHRLRQEIYREHWPTFHANPPGSTWHVENAGQLLARGKGVFAAVGRGPDALARLCDSIEAATRPTTEKLPRIRRTTRPAGREPAATLKASTAAGSK